MKDSNNKLRIKWRKKVTEKMKKRKKKEGKS